MTLLKEQIAKDMKVEVTGNISWQGIGRIFDEKIVIIDDEPHIGLLMLSGDYRGAQGSFPLHELEWIPTICFSVVDVL